MTEFEIATIAFQEATIAFQQASLRLQEASLAIQEASLGLRGESLTVAKWQVGATLLIGFGQIAVVAWGIRAMQRATERRANDARDEARRLTAADERRHAEAMQALDLQRQALETLITRTGRSGADA